MNKKYWLFFILFSSFSCFSGEPIETEGYFYSSENGEKYTGKVVDYKEHGLSKRRATEIESAYVAGRVVKVTTKYYEDIWPKSAKPKYRLLRTTENNYDASISVVTSHYDNLQVKSKTIYPFVNGKENYDFLDRISYKTFSYQGFELLENKGGLSMGPQFDNSYQTLKSHYEMYVKSPHSLYQLSVIKDRCTITHDNGRKVYNINSVSKLRTVLDGTVTVYCDNKLFAVSDLVRGKVTSEAIYYANGKLQSEMTFTHSSKGGRENVVSATNFYDIAGNLYRKGTAERSWYYYSLFDKLSDTFANPFRPLGPVSSQSIGFHPLQKTLTDIYFDEDGTARTLQ